jgi:23S rRNA (pseudouridine1915-N3)-methyltransferase
MKFRIICVGGLKEKYLKDAENEYFKRISRFGNINVTELREAFSSGKAGAGSVAEIAAAVEAEGERILKTLDSVNNNNNYVIALDGSGKDLSSEELAVKVAELGIGGTSGMSFVIGGSHGLHREVVSRADFVLSFGRKTYPHQLMRVILAEQIYRACMVNAGSAYHK